MALGVNSRQKFICKKLTLDDGHDGTLLDSGGTLETVSVDTWCHRQYFFSRFNEPRLIRHKSHIPRSSSGFRSMESKESVTSS